MEWDSALGIAVSTGAVVMGPVWLGHSAWVRFS